MYEFGFNLINDFEILKRYLYPKIKGFTANKKHCNSYVNGRLMILTTRSSLEQF